MVGGVIPFLMKAKLSASLAFLYAFTAVLAAETAPAMKPALAKGMEGTVIRQLIGQPDEIRDLKSPEVKAEKWIYRRKVTEGTYQTANMQTTIPAMVWGGDSGMKLGEAIVPDYRLKFYRVYQVTALLMVEGKLEHGRQWTEREESFAN